MLASLVMNNHMRSTCTELGFYCPKSFEGTNRKLHHALLDERQQSLVCKSCREGKNTLVELEEKHIFWLKVCDVLMTHFSNINSMISF